MKPASFRYFAPQSLDEALDLIAQHSHDGKLLAGGQSLIPAMNFRLAQPGVLIDLNPVAELSHLQQHVDGGLRIGAMTRQRTIERSPLIQQQAPLLQAAMPLIAHVQIRNRGTIGGSIAHADPAAELPAVMCALDARFRLRSRSGDRWVAANDFFVGLFTTALTSEEILVEIAIPPLPAQTGWAIQEMTRRLGDYAIVGVAARLTVDAAGLCQTAKLVYFSVGDGPVPAYKSVAMLQGEKLSEALINEAAAVASEQDIDPLADIHASAAYRRHLANVLARRALKEAWKRVESGKLKVESAE